MITIELCSNPIAWKRPGRRMIGGNVISYDKQHKEKEQTQWQMRAQYREEPLTIPLHVDITFYMPIPKSTSYKMREQMLHDYVKCYKRPDVDNLAKYVLDCMTDIVYHDDAQITELNLRKAYSSRPATLIRIVPYTNNPVVPPKDLGDDPYDDLYI